MPLFIECVQLASAAEIRLPACGILEYRRTADRNREPAGQPGRWRGNATEPTLVEAEAILRAADADLHASAVDCFQRTVEGSPEILTAEISRMMLLNFAAGAKCEERVSHRGGRHEDPRTVGSKGNVENCRAELAGNQFFERRRRRAMSHDGFVDLRIRFRLPLQDR